MADLIERALAAKRESKHVEFKQTFNPSEPGEWCELIKDIVAIANSGGGILVFGLDSSGNPTGDSLDAISQLDPAEIGNRISKYTGPVNLEFSVCEVSKQSHALVAIIVHPVSIPIIFQKPGTYDVGGGKQKTAFGLGTVYFRHGAKSEPGNSDDIRQSIERQLEVVRKSWIKGVRRVVEAPQGAQIIAVRPAVQPVGAASDTFVRVVNDPKATPVRLTRDRNVATGSFVHEEISEGIFDEINNVIDANRALAKGQRKFLLGQPVYYRVYAERHHVVQGEDDIALLFHSGVNQFYGPSLFWMSTLPKEIIAQTFLQLYVNPVNPHIHVLTRCAILFGEEFSQWLYGKWQRKWKTHPQPPSFYRTLKEMIERAIVDDSRLVAMRGKSNAQITVDEDTVTAKEIMAKPDRGAILLSKACMHVFEGDTEMRSVARRLDYLTYGHAVRERGNELGEAIMKGAGSKVIGDVREVSEVETNHN